MSRITWRCVVAALVTFAFFAPAKASAKGIVLITWGDSISHLGDVTLPDVGMLPARKVGFKYGYFGVFWMDLWTWGGEFCLYEGTRYTPLPRALAAQLIGKSESDLGSPFLYRFPLGLLIITPLAVIGIAAAVAEKRKAAKIPQLFADEKYQEALAILNEQSARAPSAPPPLEPAPGEPPASSAEPAQPGTDYVNDDRYRAAFEKGVDHLVDQGVDRDEAARNLTLMVQSIMSMPPAEGETRLTCECGKEVVVNEGAAGTSITCACGRTLTVPSVSEMRQAQ